MCRDEGLIDDARQSYKKMKRKGIGADAAAFYVQWSQLEASDGDASQARAILHKARERCGQADQARVQQALVEVSLARCSLEHWWNASAATRRRDAPRAATQWPQWLQILSPPL